MTEDKNKRIVRNTGLLYFRSFLCLLLSLYSSRLILQALGVEDFGIYNAVGGLAAMFWMVSSTLSSAVGRFLNFEMGRENPEGLDEVFSLSLNIMIILAVIAALLAEALGGWFISHKMIIPLERMEVARLIFHLSVLTMVTGFLTIPFNASITAHERMGIIAIVNIAETVLKLGVALLLTFSAALNDKLKVYAILLACITVVSNLFAMIYGRSFYRECRFRWVFKTKRLWEMLRFSFWNFIASIAGTFSGQGVNMVLNVYHGPILNTARGLTGTVVNAINILVYNFTLSTTPQITQSYAAGNIQRCKSLVFRGTRFSAFLVLLIVIPLFLEIHFVLKIWLGSFPEHTVSFLRLSLVTLFLSVFAYLFSVAKMATGNIRIYKLLISLLSILNFVSAWILLRAGFIPEWIYIVPVFIELVKIVISIFSVRKELDFGVSDVFSGVFTPVASVFALSCLASFVLHYYLPQGWFRLILVVVISVLVTGFSAFFIGCNRDERQMLLDYAISFFSKFKRV